MSNPVIDKIKKYVVWIIAALTVLSELLSRLGDLFPLGQ